MMTDIEMELFIERALKRAADEGECTYDQMEAMLEWLQERLFRADNYDAIERF